VWPRAEGPAYLGKSTPTSPALATVSNEKPDAPVHHISRVEDRQRILAEALAHVEAQEEQYKLIPLDEPVRGRWKAPTAYLVFAVAIWLLVLPPRWIAGADAPRPSEGDMDRGLRAAMYLQAQQVEVFRLAEGRLPTDLFELPTRIPGLTLVRSNNRVFQIRARRPDGSLLVYDSAQPSPTFEAAAPWRPPMPAP